MELLSREVVIAGRPATIFGRFNDNYFHAIEVMARQLDPLVTLVDHHVPRDGRILDVGANIGLSVIALARARPQAEIFAFEPSPANCELLRQNMRANDITNVEVVMSALSDETGELHFHESNFGAGSHVVSADHLEPTFASATVPMETLDDFSKRLGGRSFSFLKIDAEGHEPTILAGGREFIRRDCPLVYMEFNSWCLNAFGGHSPAAFVRSLWERFEILEESDGAGLAEAAGREPLSFLHDNLTKHGCVDDMILRLRAGAEVPTLREMTWPRAALDVVAAFDKPAASVPR